MDDIHDTFERALRQRLEGKTLGTAMLTTEQLVSAIKDILPGIIDKAIRRARGEIVDE